MVRRAIAVAAIALAAGLAPPQRQCYRRTTALRESFRDLLPDLSDAVSQALDAKGAATPTAIQRAALAPLRAGASAVLAAETGSGKSLAFLVPTVERLGEGEAVLVLAPTRELALQLAADAAGLVTEGLVQLLAVGAATTAEALERAKVIVATPKEARDAFNKYALMGAKARTLSAVVLDEVDALLPPRPRDRRSQASKSRAKAQGKRQRPAAEAPPAPAAEVVAFVVKANPNPALQVVAASATASRATRDELRRVLRNDPYGRWAEAPVDVIRADEGGADARARSVVVPAAVRHAYARVEKNAPLPVVARKVREVLEALEPKSTLVFLAAGAGFTVKDTVAALVEAGVGAEPLHSALGIDKQATRDAPAGPTDLKDVLATGRNKVADAYAQAAAGDGEQPVMVTFEQSARGLHFDAVDAVICVGLPQTAAAYLHVAGRVGRRLGGGVAEGTACTVLHPKAVPVLESWSTQLGDVVFSDLLGGEG